MELTDRLATERRARLAAERKLELKSRELFEANRKLSQHALTLSGQIIEQRGEAEKLKEDSARVRADLERAEEHVEAVERRLWDSVESITDGFAVFDAEDRLLAANTAWLSIFGFSRRIGPGTLYLEVLRVLVEEDHIDLGDAEPGPWIGDMLERWDSPHALEPVTIRLKKGSWFRLVDRRARDGDMVCLAQDVTTLKDREGELEEARHRAESANRAKSAFLANMSHELRTPMNGVVGMAEMLLDSEMDEEQRLYVSTIRSSGEALLEIINHVLDFSKMEAEQLVLRSAPFDLERLIHEVLTLVSPSARDNALGLHVDYDLFLPTHLVGDGARVRQILVNLVGNAVKFTAEGHVLIRVVEIEAPPDAPQELGSGAWQLHITVEDTGIGIPEAMRDHIFGSFAQVEDEKNRSFEGTGLGLAITRQLVELMGGEIWVESDEGRGSCFGLRVLLPSAESGQNALPHMVRGAGSVLLVSDAGLDAEIMGRQLAQLGLEVVRVRTGSEALTRAAQEPRPRFVAIDESLADTTGAALAAALEEAGCRGGRMIVSASAHDAARLQAGTDDQLAVPPHVHAVLSRPVLRGQLFEALGKLAQVAAPTVPDAPHGPDPVGRDADLPVGRADVADPSRARAMGVEGQLPTPAGVGPADPLPEAKASFPVASAPATEDPMPRADDAPLPPTPQPPAPVTEADAPSREGAGGAPDQAGDARCAGEVHALPVDPADPAPPKPAAARGPRRMRVLAAEDNKTNRFVFAKMLQSLEIDLHFAEDGVAAVEKFHEIDPDLIFMDISMPRLDGKDAARAIRDVEAVAAGPGGPSRHVPIVAMTAHALAGDREEILASGIDHYLTKPLKRGLLSEQVFAHCPPDCVPPAAAKAG